MSNKIKKPFLKWVGSKQKEVPLLLKLAPQKKDLVIPFAGGLSFFVNSHHQRTVHINDINPDLINVYQVLLKERESFIDYVEAMFHPIDKDNKHLYYTHRQRFNELNLETPLTRRIKAALFIYLNRYGFNGAVRYNSKGEFNIPIGSYKSIYFPREEMLHFINRCDQIEHLHFHVGDYKKILHRHVNSDTLILADPPYYPKNKTSFTQYHSAQFLEKEHKQLAYWIRLLTTKYKCSTILCNSDTDDVRHTYHSGKKYIVHKRQSNVSGVNKGRGKLNQLFIEF